MPKQVDTAPAFDQEVTPDNSPWFYYVCADGASNTPCPTHFPGAEAVPDNWLETYVSPTPPGSADEASIG